MVTYSTNMMGVWFNTWYEKNNIPYTIIRRYSETLDREIEVKEYEKHYAGGRIDIRGVPDEPFGLEYGLPVMECESWSLFSDWLDGLETDNVLPYQEIIDRFEQETGHTIAWFNKLEGQNNE